MLLWLALAAVISVAFSEEAAEISKGLDVTETVELSPVAQEAAESRYPIYGRRNEERDQHHDYRHHRTQHELNLQEPRHHEQQDHYKHHEIHQHELKGNHELYEQHELPHHMPEGHYEPQKIHNIHELRYQDLKDQYKIHKPQKTHEHHDPRHHELTDHYEIHELRKPHEHNEPRHPEPKGHYELHELNKPREHPDPRHHEPKGHYELHEVHKPYERHEPRYQKPKGHHEPHEKHEPLRHELKDHNDLHKAHEPHHVAPVSHHQSHHEDEHRGPSVAKLFDPHRVAHHTPHGVGIIKDVLSPDYIQPTWFLDYRYVKTGNRDYAIADGGQVMILPEHVKNHEHKEYSTFAELLEFSRLKKLAEENAHLLHPEKGHGLGYMGSREDRMEQVRGRMVHEHDRHRDQMRGHYEQ